MPVKSLSEGQHLGPLVAPDQISAERRRRGSSDNFKTLAASTKELLAEKVAIEEKEGWRVDRKNKKSIRVAQQKRLDEQLEDEVWCLMANLGFGDLSDGRHFQMRVNKDLPPRQIDVFAKDDDVAVIIECTQSDQPKKKSMSNLIDKLNANKGGLYQSVRDHYGREAKIKPRLVIATRNIVWTDIEKDKCKEAGIAILADDELDYYKQLISYLRGAAKYQFLAHIFEGTRVPGLACEVPATRIKVYGGYAYNFIIKPEDLLKISYVGHRASRNTDDLETYQRMLKTHRLKAISKFIDEGGVFPTNIVVNIKTAKARALKFEKTQEIGDVSQGNLTLPSQYASAWVVDGQHRLYGYAHLLATEPKKVQNSSISVLAYENLPAHEEMKMFIDVNCEQVKVPKSLMVELYSDLHWGSSDPSERLLSLLARVASALNSRKDSPLLNRVAVTGKKKTYLRCFTQTSISDGLDEARLLGSVRRDPATKTDIFVPGPLAVEDPNDTKGSLKKATEVLIAVLSMFAEGAEGNWSLGEKPGGYLATNNALRAIFLVIADLCNHLKKEDQQLTSYDADVVFQYLEPYFQPVVKYFNSATPEEIFSFRRQQAKVGVKKQSQGMCNFIKDAFPSFSPAGLQEYLDSRDKEGTERSVVQVNNIQSKLFEYVVRELKSHFGEKEEEWWSQGVPLTVRENCAGQREKDSPRRSLESYMYLIDYQTIALKNWEIMKSVFALGNPDVGNRKACVEWVKKINDIRNITHHPEKGILSKDQVQFVSDIHAKVTEIF